MKRDEYQFDSAKNLDRVFPGDFDTPVFRTEIHATFSPNVGFIMRFILNILWLVLAGFWMAIAYMLAGLLAFALIVTIPFGIAAFRIARHALWPFGWTAVRKTRAGLGSAVGNVVWIVLFGWWLALGHLVTGIAMCLTIIGIPLGVANFKMIPLSLLPLGTELVPSDSPAAAERGRF